MLIAGVDEAGRGAVIGPLVVAGILMKNRDIGKLVEIGVKDSKLLRPNRRQKLFIEIMRIAQKSRIIKLSPQVIDEVVRTGKKLYRLNRLEAVTMARIVEFLKPKIGYVDASDVLEDRFKQHILEKVSLEMEIVSEHKADLKYPIVSAASIIAKVERDKEIELLKGIYGDIGSGYPSDPKTINFLKYCLKTWGEYPNFVRKSWKTAKRIENQIRQTAFFNGTSSLDS